MKRITILLLLLVSIGYICGCGSSVGPIARGSFPVSLTVSPKTASKTQGETQQYAATLAFSTGETQDLTTSVTWSSSDPAVASIDPATGLATGVTPGSVVITATGTDFSDTATLTVKPLPANRLFISNFNDDSISVFDIGANGNVSPLRTISGVATQLDEIGRASCRERV